MSLITFTIFASGNGRYGMSVKKNNNNDGNPIRNENETAFDRLLKRFENICLLKNDNESNNETPSKPGSMMRLSQEILACTGRERII
jgi:hypothetical protein